MNTATVPAQGERPSWQIICVVDVLDEINQDHAFLTTLHEIASNKRDEIGEDLFRLLVAYLDTNPRQKLIKASEQLMDISLSMADTTFCTSK